MLTYTCGHCQKNFIVKTKRQGDFYCNKCKERIELENRKAWLSKCVSCKKVFEDPIDKVEVTNPSGEDENYCRGCYSKLISGGDEVIETKIRTKNFNFDPILWW